MPDPISLLVVWAPSAGSEEVARLQVAPGTTVEQAVACSALVRQVAALGGVDVKYGVWGRLAAAESLVHDGDRIERVVVEQRLKRIGRCRLRKQGLMLAETVGTGIADVLKITTRRRGEAANHVLSPTAKTGDADTEFLC